MASLGLEEKVEALLAVLNDDMGHLQAALQQLDRLRSLLIKRDDTGLEKLLTDLASEAETHSANERERQDLRQQIADQLHCDSKKVTLTFLAQSIPSPQQDNVIECQRKLKSLIGQLKHEYLSTNLLIADCARFNRALIQVFLGQSGRANVCYGAAGTVARPTDAALMSLHF
jgi:hypothetical protein